MAEYLFNHQSSGNSFMLRLTKSFRDSPKFNGFCACVRFPNDVNELLLLLLLFCGRFKFTPGTFAVDSGTETTRLCVVDGNWFDTLAFPLFVTDANDDDDDDDEDCTFCWITCCCFADTIFGLKFCIFTSSGVTIVVAVVTAGTSDFGWEMQNYKTNKHVRMRRS